MTNNRKVVKIYHRNKLTETRLSKLNLMLDFTPKSKKICWPEKLVYNDKEEFLGYIMKSAEGYKEFGVTVLKLNSKTVAENSMKGWDRLALVELCLDLCKTFQKMHERGILMGDVNYRNMMLRNSNPNNHVDYMLVDCDSYQIQGYPCPVGTMVFTSPKIYQKNNLDPASLNFGKFLRTVEDENYAIASLLFHILMLNQSPFAKKNGADNIEEAIRNYDFAYRLRDGEDTGADVPDGAFRMIWNNMPTNVKELFGDVFKRRKDVDLKTWIQVLEDYKRKIKSGKYTRELMPKLYFDYTGNFAIDFTCDACGEKRNMPRERYDRVAERNLPHLCNDCIPIKNSMKEIPIQRYCKRCGRPFQVNAWDKWLETKWNRPIKKNCRSCVEYYKSRNR